MGVCHQLGICTTRYPRSDMRLKPDTVGLYASGTSTPDFERAGRVEHMALRHACSLQARSAAVRVRENVAVVDIHMLGCFPRIFHKMHSVLMHTCEGYKAVEVVENL
jgi:hypothetical protein